MPQQESALPPAERDCVFLHQIRDWKVVDAQELLVRTGVKGWQWRLGLSARCPELNHAQVVGWDSRDRKICGGRGDGVVVRGRNCTIRSIGPARVESEE